MALPTASDNPFPSILLEDHADPAAPTNGFHRLFIDTDEKLKMIDHASLVTDFTPGALDYVEKTSSTTITGTTAGTANTVVTGASVSYDGSTPVVVEFSSPFTTAPATAGADITIGLFESSTEVGRLCYLVNAVTGTTVYTPVFGRYRFTPAAGSHTYIAKAWVSTGSGVVGAGAGGAAAAPAFMRIVKA